MEARRLVRECGRKGVVGREGKLLRVRDAERARDGGAEVGVVEAMVRCVWSVTVKMRLGAINCFDYTEQRQACRVPRCVKHEAVAGARSSILFPIHVQSISSLLKSFNCSYERLLLNALYTVL